MRVLAWLAFLFFLHEARSFLTDMGDCACVCGLQPVEDNGTRVTTQSFYDRVRGPKGYPGNSGKSGPQGPQGSQGEQGPAGPPGVSTIPGGNNAESCMEYRASGITESGIYKIKPNAMSTTTEVYCDMESAGGGWTLVASVHENDIKGKCTLGDNWSSDQSVTSNSYNGTRNWENFNTFGRPASATSDDYKSPAYFNLMANDVMIWHVPNDVEVSQWSNQAFLKYYTNTGFLNDYGGTLQSMFSKYFPVKVVASEGGSALQGVSRILEALNVSAPYIRSAVAQFYSYTYDFSSGTVQNYIADGGRDMFDTGNKVYYQIDSEGFRQITYRAVYKERSGVEISSSTEHPFIALMWIGNSERTASTFDLKVESGTGADGNGYYGIYIGRISHQSFSLQYKSYNVYDANDPSISEVFFLIESSENWGSISPSSFTSVSWSSTTDNLVNTMRASGSPQSVMMGYTLLSRRDDHQIHETDIQTALMRILETVSQFQSISTQNCNQTSDSLVVPINYVAGGNQTVLSHVPPRLRNSVTPGFIQFRPLSSRGIPNAICPGIRTETCRPSRVCVGGINTLSVHSEYASECGDFGAWDGARNDLPAASTPDGLAHSLNDIASSILIFTRSETTNQFN